MGTSSDPYPPEEIVYKITRNALRILLAHGRKVLITTKGTLYASRDLDILVKGNFAVTPTITTLSKEFSLLFEPGAPLPDKRLDAIRHAASEGVPIGVRVDPIIPYVNDDPYEIEELVGRIADSGAIFIVTSTYKARPDNFARILEAVGADLVVKLKSLYAEGETIQGYRYLKKSVREKLLRPVIKAASYYGLEYAVCREGLYGKEWFNAASCDGTHLIPNRISPRRIIP